MFRFEVFVNIILKLKEKNKKRDENK